MVECAVCKGLASFMTGVSPIYQESKFIVGRVLFYTDYKRSLLLFIFGWTNFNAFFGIPYKNYVVSCPILFYRFV